MQTMNQALANLYFRRQITMNDAMSRSSDIDELRQIIAKGPARRPGSPDNK